MRRPTTGDLEAVFRIHGDPRTNVHNPAGPDPDRTASEARLQEWLEHWDRHEFGYWVVENLSAERHPRNGPDAVMGFTGVRHEA